MSDINETFNMSLRSFLKQVGVTSQKAVEDWVRENSQSGGSLAVKMVLTSDNGLEHVVEGEIKLD